MIVVEQRQPLDVITMQQGVEEPHDHQVVDLLRFDVLRVLGLQSGDDLD